MTIRFPNHVRLNEGSVKLNILFVAVLCTKHKEFHIIPNNRGIVPIRLAVVISIYKNTVLTNIQTLIVVTKLYTHVNVAMLDLNWQGTTAWG